MGKVTRDATDGGEHHILITGDTIDPFYLADFEAVLTNWPASKAFDFPGVYEIPDFEHLSDGDIVVINTDGVINTLYRVHSHHNFILFTERCNSNCLMCSQPPRDKDDSYLIDIYEQLIPLIPKDCFELGITGGEPTLLGNRFFQLLSLIQKELPDTEIHCLTNGRSFAWNNVADRMGSLGMSRLMLGIPLYSDRYATHDYIVQAPDAFHQTVRGLYNLARVGQRIEIRVVLHRLTIPRLLRLAQFIYKNLPFVEHVTFMGLEYQGYTPYNIEKLWIDPADYAAELTEAMLYLSDMGIRASLYNSQLCIVPKELWPFNRKSISDWKNIYLPVCESCSVLDQCGGLFASGVKQHSRGIMPLIDEVIPVLV